MPPWPRLSHCSLFPVCFLKEFLLPRFEARTVYPTDHPPPSDARNVNVRGKRSEADLIGNYGLQACPSDNPVVRNTKGALLDAEVNLLRSRRQSVQRALQSFFNRVTIDDFDAASYVGNPSSNSLVPTVGLAFSGGGGYRSFLTSAGAWSAFDNMNPFAMREDGLGGLLQAATYVSGQDSSAWLLASIYMNNFTTVQDLQSRVAKDSSLWDFSRTVLQGPPPAKGQSESSATDSYLDDIKQKVKARTDSNWNTSLPDVWYVIFLLFFFWHFFYCAFVMLVITSANRLSFEKGVWVYRIK